MLRINLSRRCLSPFLACLMALAFALPASAASSKVTDADLNKVFAAYQQAKAAGFTPEALVKLYQTPGVPDVPATIKKLVDLQQAEPQRSISTDDSKAMETSRQKMNMEVLQHLAVVTGGTIEVMDAGKQNGIRSDKDLMIFGVVDGNRTLTATETKKLYEDTWKEKFGLDLKKMDMTIFDGDAVIPDWRKTSMSLSEYVEKFKKGQAKLEQNPEAVKEAGTWRQGAELRYATNSMVTMVKHRRDPNDPRLKSLKAEGETRAVVNEFGETLHFDVIENVHVKEASVRYQGWHADMPYRNAMDAAYEWRQKFNESNDFIDKMKYFNRTIGDGINALALQGWDKQYIFHLAKLETPELRKAFIQRMVEQVFVVDLSPEQREHFVKVMEISANIELDKMRNKGQVKSESVYLTPIKDAIRNDLKKQNPSITEEEVLAAAREKFFGFQQEIMKYNLMATTRHKLRADLTDQRRLARLIDKFTSEGHDGLEEVKKLHFETWRQVGRIIDGIDDDKLIGRIISDAPEAIRPRLQRMHDIAKARRQERAGRTFTQAKSDPKKAATTGPEEQDVSKKTGSDLDDKEKKTESLLEQIKQQFSDFRADAEAGKYSDEAITARMKERMLDMMGFEQREAFNKMQGEFETKFSKSKLLNNVVDLGNYNSLLSILQVYQETGDMKAVVQTAAWEVFSNVPGVSQIATLKQAFNDGNVEGLWWMFIAYQVPAAGQIKMIFDAAAGTVTLVYNHAMNPLKDDRFSQVYMGYVDAQPAGWSPLKPGVKERQQAAGDSILHFVPGATFEEKRTNMYAYFHKILDGKLQANGIKPTMVEYADKYDKIIEPFFRKYVFDYFNAAGEWSENTTVGLKAIGQQEELSNRLIATLVRDFKAGEANFEKQQAAQTMMEEAMKQADALAKKSIELEKKLAGAQDFLATKLAEAMRDGMTRPKPVQGLGLSVVRAQAFPPVIREGEEAKIVVRATSPAVGEGSDKPHIVEVKRVDRPFNNVVPPVSVEDIRKELEEDVALIKSLLDVPDAKVKPMRLARVEYEVIVKDAAGKELGRDRVFVKIAGEDQGSGNEGGVAMLRIALDEKGKVRDPGNQDNTIKYTDNWLPWDEGKKHVNTWNMFSRAAPFNTYGGLYLWITWDKAPPRKQVWFEVNIKGGIPAFDQTMVGHIEGFERFYKDERPKNGFVSGPCFQITPWFPTGKVGRFLAKGRLVAYDEYPRDEKHRAELKPLAEFPFHIEFEVPLPPRTAEAGATVNETNVMSGNVKLQNIQPGVRPAKVTIGGKSCWQMMTYNSVNFYWMHGVRDATEATISFRDYGQDFSITVPLKIHQKPDLKPFDPKYHKEQLEWVAKYEKETNYNNLRKISGCYASMAHQIFNENRMGTMAAEYLALNEKSMEILDRAIAMEKNKEELGYLVSEKFGRIGNIIHTLHYTHELEAAKKWFERQKQALEQQSAKDKDGATISLAYSLGRIAEMTFRVTGDVAASKALWEEHNRIRASVPGFDPTKYTLPKFPYVPDDDFKETGAGGK